MKLSPPLWSLLVAGQLLAMSFDVRAADGDATRGAKLYDSRCGACHSIEKNRVGPRHRDLFGRSAGTQRGYAYSRALKQSDVVWDARTLDRWLANPQALIPGQKMGFRVRKAQDRSDIIAFLRGRERAKGSSTK